MTSITTPNCFSILGIALFSASMRGWRCSAMRMVGGDAPELEPVGELVPEPEHETTTATAAAAAISPTVTPARSTVTFIGLLAAIGMLLKVYTQSPLRVSFFRLIVYPLRAMGELS